MPVASIARAHQPTECVDLANQMAFGGAADGRIARHVRDGAVRQRADPHAAAQPRGRPRGLNSGVAGANHDHI